MKQIHIPYGEQVELFQGKNQGDIYIKVPKDSDIDVKVDVVHSAKINSLNELRDEYHSIGELYEFRKAYNALLFNEWAIDYIKLIDSYKGIDYNTLHTETRNMLLTLKPKYDVHKSWKHNDGELCFGGGWFIVVAILPTGQITNHYKAEDWDLFQIPEAEKAKYEFDGHTPQDTLQRMKDLLTKK